jgi:hypothetical protein
LLFTQHHGIKIYFKNLITMLFLTKWFGVTENESERKLDSEQLLIEEIAKNILIMQSKTAGQQNRPLRRGTHAKGICVQGQFEIFNSAEGGDAEQAARIAKGIFSRPGIYPAVVRFANADSNVNRDSKPDVRSLSFSVDLTGSGKNNTGPGESRQDFSLQNATFLPINDSPAFLAITKVLIASNPGKGLMGLPLKDKLRVFRTLALTKILERQPFKAYQQLRYWSNTPFRHGPNDFVKYSAMPSPENKANPMNKKNPDCLQDELARHLREDETMSHFDFGIQFLDKDRMTYWGKKRDDTFWIENASVEWKESEAAFHTVGRLTLLPNSMLSAENGEKVFFDVMGNSLADSKPVGSINRARQRGDLTSSTTRLGIIQNDVVNKQDVSERM